MEDKKRYRIAATISTIKLAEDNGKKWVRYKGTLEEYEGDFIILVPRNIHESNVFSSGMEVGLVSTDDTDSSNLIFTLSPHSKCLTGKNYNINAPVGGKANNNENKGGPPKRANNNANDVQESIEEIDSKPQVESRPTETGQGGYHNFNNYQMFSRDPRISMQEIIKFTIGFYEFCKSNDLVFKDEIRNILETSIEIEAFVTNYIQNKEK